MAMENIIKQGYLKKAKPIAADSPRSNLCSSLLQLFESSRWYMFIVRNGRPYLEIFEKEQNAYSGQPITSYELSSCYKITYTLGRTSKAWTFCLFLEERVLEITADSREQMLDWCRNLERTLVHYGKIKQNTEHVYVEYPVRYTPKKTGLEQEARFEASASASASGPPPHSRNSTLVQEPSQEDYKDFINMINHIDDDEEESDGEETNPKTDLSGGFAGPQSPEVPAKPKNYVPSPQGAVGGSSVNADVDSDNDVDTSEDDFVNKDFWLSNKLTPVPQRSESQKIRNSGRPFSEFDIGRINSMSSSVPPLPARGKSLIEKGPTFISSLSCDSDPKPPPRRKRTNLLEGGLKKTASKSVSEDNVSVRSPLVTSNADDIEDLDDGYDSVVELRKSNSDSAATDPWVRSLENNNENSRKSTLKAYDDAQLFVRLPDAGMEESEDFYILDTPTPDDNVYFNWTQKPVGHTSSSDEEGVHATGNKMELDSAAAAVKQMTLGGKDENYNLCDSKVHEQSVVHDKEIASNIYDFGKSYLVKEPINVRAENIYDFARSEGTLVHTQIPPSPQASLPQRSSMAVHPPAFATSEFSDSLYSIPKSAKPVAGLSTEEVLRPCRQSWRITPEPTPTLYSVPQKRTSKSQSSSSMVDVESPKALYSVPQKKASKSHSSSSMEESCENSKSSTTPKTKSMDSFLAPKPPSLDTLPNKKPPSLEKLSYAAAAPLDSLPSQTPTSVTSPVRRSPISLRPLPSLPTDIDYSSDKQKAERATSPSHDGFTFNFVPDAETNSKSSTTSSSGSGASKEEDTEPVYEDATGRNSNPPLPPKRTLRKTSNRSVSVYIPGKTGGTLTTRLDPTPARAESLDDQAISRPKVGRQISLTERQQIRQSSSSIVVIPLKQSQVDLLNEEQKLHGVGLDISPKSANAIALVEMYNGIWIAGWDGRRFPRLAEKIHIGDQLLSVEDVRVTSSYQASKLLKQTQSQRVTFVVKRLPYATILAVRRNRDGENLGITREGGTAEITYVDPNGLVARCGLQKRAKSVEGTVTGECNWMLTEINCRSLNFSFKGEEIERLLNAVGRDISLVVQPVDFVKQIKKQLKKLKNYREYLY